MNDLASGARTSPFRASGGGGPAPTGPSEARPEDRLYGGEGEAGVGERDGLLHRGSSPGQGVSLSRSARRSGEEKKPTLAIYIHWPFCRSKCPYCDFNSHVRTGVDRSRWTQAL